MVLGEKLKQLIAEKQTTITALAQYIGMSRPTLYHIMEGKSELKLKNALAIARFFHIPLESLYELDQEEIPAPIHRLAAHFGLSKSNRAYLAKKQYDNLARKELAKILREAAAMLDVEEA
jgi:DNA-binding XRE family transcriptional regulator